MGGGGGVFFFFFQAEDGIRDYDVTGVQTCALPICGAAWPLIWDDPDTKLWLAVLTSTFGMMLLPIAYITFFMMMNSKTLMGDQKPTGGRMMIWNVLMIVSVLIAIVAAGSAIWEKVTPIVDPEAKLAVRIVGGTVLCVTIEIGRAHV